jgi:hypothetical protein
MDNTAMNDTDKSELIEFFQANYLDGDAIQQGQMVSSTVVKEFITDFVEPLITQQCNQARKDELFKTYTQVIGDEKAPHSRYSRVTKIFTEYLKKRNAELKAQAKESNKGE